MNTPPPRRFAVNLDPLAELLDRALQSPAGALAAQILPETTSQVRALRENLPAVAAGIQDKAGEVLRAEGRALERKLAGELGRFLDEALVQAKERIAPRRRLPAKRKRK